MALLCLDGIHWTLDSRLVEWSYGLLAHEVAALLWQHCKQCLISIVRFEGWDGWHDERQMARIYLISGFGY